jgi:hypothetical protein
MACTFFQCSRYSCCRHKASLMFIPGRCLQVKIDWRGQTRRLTSVLNWPTKRVKEMRWHAPSRSLHCSFLCRLNTIIQQQMLHCLHITPSYIFIIYQHSNILIRLSCMARIYMYILYNSWDGTIGSFHVPRNLPGVPLSKVILRGTRDKSPTFTTRIYWNIRRVPMKSGNL